MKSQPKKPSTAAQKRKKTAGSISDGSDEFQPTKKRTTSTAKVCIIFFIAETSVRINSHKGQSDNLGPELDTPMYP